MIKLNREKLIEKIKKLSGNRKAIVIVAALILVGGFIGFKVISGNKSEQTQLQTTQIERGQIISSASASGQVLSVNVMSANTQAKVV